MLVLKIQEQKLQTLMMMMGVVWWVNIILLCKREKNRKKLKIGLFTYILKKILHNLYPCYILQQYFLCIGDLIGSSFSFWFKLHWILNFLLLKQQGLVAFLSWDPSVMESGNKWSIIIDYVEISLYVWESNMDWSWDGWSIIICSLLLGEPRLILGSNATQTNFGFLGFNNWSNRRGLIFDHEQLRNYYCVLDFKGVNCIISHNFIRVLGV